MLSALRLESWLRGKPGPRPNPDLHAHAETYLKDAWAREKKKLGRALTRQEKAQVALHPLLVADFWQAVAPPSWVQGERRFLPWAPLETALFWGPRGDEPLYTTDTPPALEVALALTDDPARIEQAEALAREVNRRLLPWGGAPVEHFVWGVLEDESFVRTYTLVDQLAAFVQSAERMDRESQPNAYRSLENYRGVKVWPDLEGYASAETVWKALAARQGPFPLRRFREGRDPDPSFPLVRERAVALGENFAASPSPFTPLLELSLLGYTLLGAGSTTPVLLLARNKLPLVSAPTLAAVDAGAYSKVLGWLDTLAMYRATRDRRALLEQGRPMRRIRAGSQKFMRVAGHSAVSTRLADGSWAELMPDATTQGVLAVILPDENHYDRKEELLGMDPREALALARRRNAADRVDLYPDALSPSEPGR